MARGKQPFYLNYAALVLLSAATLPTTTLAATIITPITTAAIDIWAFDPDESPAPPVRLSPPFSKNAIRNTAVLPYQIIGIIGAYIAAVLLIGSLLLTVGRSSRKHAQNRATEPASTELVKPLTKIIERSPHGEQKPWYSPQRLRQKRSEASSMRSSSTGVGSPGMDSIASFDRGVIEADKVKRQVEMERLYAAVMASDEGRGGGDGVTQQQRNVTALPPMTPELPPQYSNNQLQNVVADGRNQHPLSPRTPVRAIYPPDNNVPGGLASPTSPVRAGYAPGSSDSSTARSKWGRKSARGVKISAPIARTGDDNSDGARTPLSPRFYADPGIPPEPPTAGTQRSGAYPPATPATPGANSEPGWGDEIDEVRDLPRANPQRAAPYQYANQAQVVTDVASTRPDPNRTGGRTPAAVGSGTLPLREMNRQYAAQQQQSSSQHPAFPLSPTTWNAQQHRTPTSAGPVKTTFLDVPHRDPRAVLGSAAPLTGVPTPYSAYMPYTPVTPVTAGLTTRAERKQRERERRRERAPPTMEEDAVEDEEDMWGEGY